MSWSFFVGILALAAAAKVAAADVAIEARNYEFVEPAVTISVGDTVTWTFSGALHSVTSGVGGVPDGGFDSGLVSEFGLYERTFTAAGTYPYFCEIHFETMTGTIVVGAASSTPAPTAAPTVPPASSTARPSAAEPSAPTPSASGTGSGPA